MVKLLDFQRDKRLLYNMKQEITVVIIHAQTELKLT